MCVFKFTDTVFLGHIGTDEGLHPDGVDQCLWWRAIQTAAEEAFKAVDLGETSPHAAGLSTYEKRWGAIEAPTPLFYFPRFRGLARLDNERRLSHQLIRSAWRNMPETFARSLSQAFSNYGGPLAADPQTTQNLVGRAVDLAAEHSCRQLELRNLDGVDGDLVTCTDKVCMCLSLSRDPGELWSRVRSEIRNRVRKAEKADLNVAFGGLEMLSAFYRVWTARMQELGTAGYPRSLFRRILEVFPEHATIGLVRLGEQTVGAGLFCCFDGFAECRWAATDIRFNALAPNVLLD